MRLSGKSSKKKAAVALGVLGVACLSGLLAHRAHRADLHLFRTKFGLASVCTEEGPDGRPVRLLRVGRSVQSATYLGEDDWTEPVFDYHLAFDLMFEAKPDIANVLVLGGGGYAYPKHLIAARPGVRVDVVEVDPAINDIARRYFFLSELVDRYGLEGSGRLGLTCADACDYLADLAGVLEAGLVGGAALVAGHADRLALLRQRYGAHFGARYDAAVVDVFAAGNPVASLATPQAAHDAHACLTPGGVLVANVVSTLEGLGSAFLHGYVAALETAFAYVRVVPLAADTADAAPDNVIVLASDADWTPS